MQALAVLFTAFGSEVPALTVPTVQTCPTAERQGTLIITVAVLPTGIAAQLQVTV